MKHKKELSKKRAGFRLNMMAGFREIPQVSIPVIPKKRTKFPGTKDDYWYELDITGNDNVTACVYEFGIDSVFPPHFHLDSCEQFIPITKGAIWEVITEEKECLIEFPNSCHFKKGEKHAIVNKSGKRVEFIVMWKPKMNGWEA